jgi:polo-like kinase 1
MLHRANTAVPMSSAGATQRSASPRAMAKPDFREGSVIEERDSKTGRVATRYRVGKLLGRGGFAKCYEFIDVDGTGETLAGKVIDRASLQKSKTLQKLHSEIAIHRRMKHRNIVNFIRTFQDEWFVYIILEKCSNQTLMEVSKTRTRFSVPETQHIMLQSIAAIQYMHEQSVIHRDLKLGNMMMDAEMNVKIGDFGLAAELAYDGERKRTICGTPNYIAPEILENARDGHSFEVDVWSLGVILYTLLVGEPPFQTQDVKLTYNRIKQCRFEFPTGVAISESGKELVCKILQSRPDRRPTLVEIRNDIFFKLPSPPMCAPITLFPEPQRRRLEREGYGQSCQAPAGTCNPAAAASGPRDALKPLWGPNSQVPQAAPSSQQAGSARPSPRDGPSSAAASVNPSSRITPVPSSLGIADGLISSARAAPQRTSSVPAMKRDAMPTVGGWCAPAANDAAAAPSLGAAPSQQKPSPRREAAKAPVAAAVPSARGLADDDDEKHHLTAVHDKLHQSILGQADGDDDANSIPLTPPAVWVTDYADFSAKYGLAYRLSSGHTGVHYNDSTKMVWEPVTGRTEYYARVKETINGVVHAQDQRQAFHMDSFPESLNKKVTLIKYFKPYLCKSRGQRDGIQVVQCSPFVNNQPVLLSEPNMVSDMIYVKRWLITKQAMIFRLSSKVIQVCFFDRTEVILSPESKVVTYTDASGRRRTILLASAASQSEEIANRLKYTKDILCKLINNKEL